MDRSNKHRTFTQQAAVHVPYANDIILVFDDLGMRMGCVYICLCVYVLTYWCEGVCVCVSVSTSIFVT